jgi:hypothetical protein
VTTTASVVLASADDRPISSSLHVRVVPYGDGTLTLHRPGGESRATLEAHYFGGSSETSVIEGDSRGMPFELYEAAQDGRPVEWFDVRFGAHVKEKGQ